MYDTLIKETFSFSWRPLGFASKVCKECYNGKTFKSIFSSSKHRRPKNAEADFDFKPLRKLKKCEMKNSSKK
jgi:hypothetical protein